MDYLHESAQAAAKRGSEKALLKEAEALLPERLATLADQKGFHFRSVRVRKLKGRWGSCNQNHDIVLNSYLMQLPWHLIDYVLLHELVHTRVMAHGKPFWAELGKYVKDLPTVRKVMRQQHPHLKPN